jgi:hypothetical protein
MKIEIKLVRKAYMKLLFFVFYKKPMMIFLSLIGVLMFFGSILYFIGIKIPVDHPPYFQLVFGFFILFLVPYVIYNTAKKSFSTHGRLKEKFIYEFNEDRYSITGETFRTETVWTINHKIVETKNWVLIYHNKLMINALPKSSFGDNIISFKDLIRQAKVKANLKR